MKYLLCYEQQGMRQCLILKCLNNSPNERSTGKLMSFKIQCFVDFDWVGSTCDRRSTS